MYIVLVVESKVGLTLQLNNYIVFIIIDAQIYSENVLVCQLRHVE